MARVSITLALKYTCIHLCDRDAITCVLVRQQESQGTLDSF